MADIIPREFIQLLLAKVDLVDLINQQIPLRKKSGSNYFARCPFHNEKSASFSVSQPKQFFYCFGCGAHGNAIDFFMQHDRLSFPEAVEALARLAGMEVPRTAAAVKKNESLPALFDLMTAVADYFYHQMRHSERAIHYLKGRGISGEIAKQFHLGYATTGWSHLLDQFGKSDEDRKKLLDAGLIIRKQEGGFYDRFRDRILFPIHDYRGRIIGFGGRILDQGEPKYLNSPETPLFQKGHELYGLYQAIKANRRLDRILIVEGYMDVIALFQHGITYAVATLGTATTSHHLHRLHRYTTEMIFCFDGDQAGRTAAWRALQVVLPHMQDNMQIRFLFLPDGEDPDSLVRKEGKPAFEARLQSALSLSAFFFQTVSQPTDLGTLEGRAQFASAALSYLKQLPAGIFQSIMLEELSKRARVDLAKLKQELNPGATPPANEPAPTRATLPTGNKLPAPLRLVLALLLQQPSLAAHIKHPLPESPLPGYAFLLDVLAIIKQYPDITPAALIEHWRGTKEESFVMGMLHFEHLVPEQGIQKEFLAAIDQLTLLNFDQEINRLLAKAAQEGLSEEEKVELSAWIGRKKCTAPV